MISLCITCRNRATLLERCLRTLLLPTPYARELVLTDWSSTDRPPLQWIPQLLDAQLPATYIFMDHAPFSRGRGLNVAARRAMYPFLFFLDTDMLVEPQVIEAAVRACAQGHAYFPICYSYTQPQSIGGYWRKEGFGITAMPRDLYEAAGGWDEFQHWGGEDIRMHERVARLAPVERAQQPGLHHQWHPPSTR